jgi:hypothetical protein
VAAPKSTLHYRARPTDGMKARFVGKSAFLPKPYTVEELSTTLSAHFEIKPPPGDP